MPHLTLPISFGGPLVDVLMGVSVPRQHALTKAKLPVPAPLIVRALIDTGASCTVVDCSILKALGVVSTGVIPIHTPSTKSGQPHLANQFDVSLIFSHPKLNWQFPAIPVLDSDLAHQGITALLGRDILKECLLNYDGVGGAFSLAF
jgi:hypothetical protein